MYTYQYNDHSGDGAFLAVIERECRRLMRQGGGALPGERKQMGPIRRVTPEQRAKVIELAATGRYGGTVIGKMVGVRQSLVHKIARQNGFALPDGRVAANRLRAQEVAS